jgi:hypothetical protein
LSLDHLPFYYGWLGTNNAVSLAVKFLESMGLPQPMLSVTRKQVEQGKIDLKSSLEYRMYSRHDKPVEEEVKGSTGLE